MSQFSPISSMKKVFLLLLALLTTVPGLRADILKGRVVDAVTGEPLDGARVTATMNSGEGTSNWQLMADTLGYFSLPSYTMRRITLRAEYFGYKSGSVQVLSSLGADTVRIDDIRLEPSEVLMRELAVEGRARRFVMRGDTVVFNPQAFPVEDSERLQDLVLRLPGVSVKDGALLWNGRPVRLLMNGREALSEDMLLRQLPVEAVENIKAYERKSELEEQTGVDDGKREQVLDVTVKPNFMDRWNGELQATAYSGKNYAAKTEAMRLSDTDPVMMNLRVADDPRVVEKYTFDMYSDYGADDAVRQQMGDVGYKHAWRGFEGATRESYWALVGGANHRDTPHSRWEQVRNYLPDTQPTETDTEESTRRHRLSAPLDFSSRFDFSPQNRMQLNGTLAYEQEEQAVDQQQRTYGEELINTADYQSSSHSEGLSAQVLGKFVHMLKKGMLGASLDAGYRHGKERGSSLGTYHYVQDGRLTLDGQRFRAPSDKFNLDLELGFMQTLGRKATLVATWTTGYEFNYRDERRWRSDTLDLANTLHRRDNLWRNELGLATMLTLGKFSLQPQLTLSHRHERTEYRRGHLDTLACRNLLLPTPQLELNYRIAPQQGLRARVQYLATPSQLTDCIAYTDDTRPLFVTEGNPDLRTAHTLTVKLFYNLMRSRGSQSLGIGLDYIRNYDPVATVLHYNTATGGYRSRQRNVRGGDHWQGRIDYERSLCLQLQMKNLLTASRGLTYGLLTLVDDATGLAYNRQSRSRLSDRLTLTYDTAPWRAELAQELTWDGYAYRPDAPSTASTQSQPREDILRYDLSLRLRYTLQSGWHFTLSPRLLVNRGYLSPSMNDTPFLLNAEITYKFTDSRSASGEAGHGASAAGNAGSRGALLRHLANRAEVTLAARDLLGQERRHTSAITATSHTEGGESLLHRYVTLTFRYRWDPPKKK